MAVRRRRVLPGGPLPPRSGPWIVALGDLLGAMGYRDAAPSAGAVRLVTQRAYGLGPFFPCTDAVFLHDGSSWNGTTSFEALHERARSHMESFFPWPRPWRYHIPNTVSVAVSETGFSEETVGFARKSKLRHQIFGGEKNSTYLFDIAGKRMISQGPEATPGLHGTRWVSPGNPTNRIFDLMTGLFRTLRENTVWE